MDTSGPTLTDDEKEQIAKILEQQNPDALAAQVAKIFRQKFQKELEEKTSSEGELQNKMSEMFYFRWLKIEHHPDRDKSSNSYNDSVIFNHLK